jgi:predicted nucleic acid-binding protein
MRKRKLKIYFDTSVPNAFLDTSNKERCFITRQFWKKLKNYQVYISDLVEKEIDKTGDLEKKKKLKKLIKPFKKLKRKNISIQNLTDVYLSHKIVPKSYREDAEHLAIATFYQIEIFASWNFRHIVKLKTIEKINAINKLMGYPELKIVEPTMLLYE